jgi:hypothetical protein
VGLAGRFAGHLGREVIGVAGAGTGRAGGPTRFALRLVESMAHLMERNRQ